MLGRDSSINGYLSLFIFITILFIIKIFYITITFTMDIKKVIMSNIQCELFIELENSN